MDKESRRLARDQRIVSHLRLDELCFRQRCLQQQRTRRHQSDPRLLLMALRVLLNIPPDRRSDLMENSLAILQRLVNNDGLIQPTTGDLHFLKPSESDQRDQIIDWMTLLWPWICAVPRTVYPMLMGTPEIESNKGILDLIQAFVDEAQSKQYRRVRLRELRLTSDLFDYIYKNVECPNADELADNNGGLLIDFPRGHDWACRCTWSQLLDIVTRGYTFMVITSVIAPTNVSQQTFFDTVIPSFERTGSQIMGCNLHQSADDEYDKQDYIAAMTPSIWQSASVDFFAWARRDEDQYELNICTMHNGQLTKMWTWYVSPEYEVLTTSTMKPGAHRSLQSRPMNHRNGVEDLGGGVYSLQNARGNGIDLLCSSNMIQYADTLPFVNQSVIESSSDSDGGDSDGDDSDGDGSDTE